MRGGHKGKGKSSLEKDFLHLKKILRKGKRRLVRNRRRVPLKGGGKAVSHLTKLNSLLPYKMGGEMGKGKIIREPRSACEKGSERSGEVKDRIPKLKKKKGKTSLQKLFIRGRTSNETGGDLI